MVDFSKYPKELIKSIAEEIDMGMICFLNTDTLEVESVLGESYNAYGDDDFEDFYQEVYDKVDNWVNVIRIEPPQSWQSFKIMEDFIETCILDDDSVKKRLWNAISKRKPFQNFKFIIDDSRYRQCWFDFKQSKLEQFVLEQLF
ncbi:MAG: UPF0158 family protein [Prevotella sp.]|jgi:hypothetical protein|nr:UPF0158 family protein [Prevotella sp.]